MKHGHCPEHTPQDNRPSARKRGYDAAWEAIRKQVLLEEPTCTAALLGCLGAELPEVHHKDGDPWNRARSNLTRHCKHCHSTITAREQAFGRREAGWKNRAPAAPAAPVFG